jgi:hypothetical protein
MNRGFLAHFCNVRPSDHENSERSAKELVEVRDDTETLGEEDIWLFVLTDCKEGESLSV